VTDINGKSLKHEHYALLKELGIEIVVYDLKTHVDHSSGMKQVEGKLSYGFEVYGSLTEDVNFDELYELLLLLKTARDSNVPAIKDLLDRLKIVIKVANDE